jgi:hypothetical protein
MPDELCEQKLGPPDVKIGYELEDLIKRCQPDQLHVETDWGNDIGREVID